MQISVNQNAIYSFLKSCNRLGQVGKILESEWMLLFVQFTFQQIHALLFQVFIQIAHEFPFPFPFQFFRKT